MGRPPHGLTVALVAAALSLAGCGGGHRSAAKTKPAPPSVRYERLTGPTFDVPLPQVVGGPAAVNDAMRAALVAVTGDSKDGRLTEVSKETTLTTSRVASVRLVLDLETGGAHGITVVQTFIADLAGAKLLTTADLFPPGSAWLQFLSDQSRAQLAAVEGYEEDTARAGTEPKPDNFRHVALTADALTVTFDAYQVGPFALGTPTVTITYASLASAGLSAVIDRLLGRPSQ